MYIAELSLRDYRSWPELNLRLKPGIVLLVGRNGFGKTNVIEAIGYLASLSSHRVSQDAPLIRTGAENSRISATAVNQGRELTAHILLKSQGSNLAQINRTRLKNPREVLGVIKSVLFAPEDLSLVRGEPEQRRRYLDEIIASRTPRLAGIKADYDKVLRQRNALLKSASGQLRRGYNDIEGASALSTLDVWDGQLARLGAQVLSARLKLVDLLGEHIAAAYRGLAPESRPAYVQYHSTILDAEALVQLKEKPEALEAHLLTALAAARNREIDRGISLVGPHRDDLQLMLGDTPAKGFASHGETWSYALALRLAQFELLRTEGTDPVLVLDDVFAELDAQRRERLVKLALEAEQVFITAAVEGDLPEAVDKQENLQRFFVDVHDGPTGRISVLR